MQKKFSENGFGTACLIFIIVTVIALPLRIIQYFTVMEPETGFYTEAGFTVWLFFGVLVAAAAAIYGLGLSKKKSLALSAGAEKRPGCGAFAALAAAGCVFDILRTLGLLGDLLGDTYSSSEAMASANALRIVYIGELVFGALSIVYFALSAYGFFSGKGCAEGSKILSLTPVLWLVFRLIVRFTRKISFIRVSELLLEMLMLAFFIMFFMAYAQVNSKVGGENCEYKVASYGLIAAMLAIICFVPRFVLTVCGKADMIYTYSALEYCDFTCALFALATVFTRITARPAAVDAPVVTENSAAGE